MYLKALELSGFKSFSNKTYIEFTNGITSIVGPNGSGKSNILDAILWVLGEQSYKSIRASSSLDVIFSGGKNKGRASSAEVSLIIENKDRYLDFDSDEIKITRRIYRNGEGEYLINNKKIRLKDIHNLFMDTGIGKQAYSIIGQGRVERIIGSNPKEIREIIEEAAGTKRAKVEKEEALKKLSNVNIELEKIIYVEKELETRVKRLKDESEKASLYRLIVNEIDIKNYMIYEYNLNKLNDIKNEIKLKKINLEEEIKNIEINLENENNKLKEYIEIKSNLYSKLENYKIKINQINFEYENNKNELNEIIKNKSNFEVQLSEKLKIKNKLIEEKNILENKLDDLIKNISIYQKDVNKKYDKKIVLEKKVEELTSLKMDLDSKIIECDKKIHDFEITRFRIKSENDDLERKIKLSKVNIENLKKEKEEIKIEFKKNNLILNNLELKEKEINKLFKENIIENQNINSRINKLQKEKQDKNIYINKKIYEKNQKESILISKQKNIDENFFSSKAVKHILKNYKSDGNVVDTVANLLEIPDEYLTAISTLSNANLNDIVIKKSNLSSKYIQDLKDKQVGSLSFIPLDLIKTYTTLKQLPKIDGIIDFSRNLVNLKMEEDKEKIIHFIFSNSIVVKDLNVAKEVSKIGFNDRIVTLDGDIISARGRISGGYKKQKIDLTLKIKEEINILTNEVKKLEEEIELELHKNKLIDKEIEKLNAEIELISNKDDVKYKLLEIRNQIEIKKNEISNINRKNATIDYEILDSENIIIENINKISENDKKSSLYYEEMEKTFENKANYEFEYSEMEDVEEYKNKLHNLLIEYAIVNEKLTNSKNNKDELEKNFNNISKDLLEIDQFENNKDALFSNYYKEIEKYELIIDNLLINKKECEDNIAYSENKIKSAHKNEEDSISVINKLEKEIIKTSNSIENLAENIGRNEKEIEIIIEKLENLDHKKDEITNDNSYYKIKEDDIVKIKKEINNLENKKLNIGSVNLASIDEYNVEKERYDILVNQKDDLEKSSNSIKNLINNIENEMTSKFSIALNEIKNNFKFMCNEIFYGAKADIKLLDEKDILNTGLELSVKYKNKPEQTLMLLSGGEKSMLAVSFIMAIFMFKPSPFTFFDEIEAALDEANTKKIVELLRRFITKSQFILITHNKETMKGSDRLYGVTMNKEVGESRIVSVDI